MSFKNYLTNQPMILLPLLIVNMGLYSFINACKCTNALQIEGNWAYLDEEGLIT